MFNKYNIIIPVIFFIVTKKYINCKKEKKLPKEKVLVSQSVQTDLTLNKIMQLELYEKDIYCIYNNSNYLWK